MQDTWIISIDEQPNQSGAAFDPQSLTVAAGDIIYWRNNTDCPHWPAPKGKPRDSWMDAEIPGKLPGEPAPTSQQGLTFSGATTVEYVCALDPDMTGTIIVQ